MVAILRRKGADIFRHRLCHRSKLRRWEIGGETKVKTARRVRVREKTGRSLGKQEEVQRNSWLLNAKAKKQYHLNNQCQRNQIYKQKQPTINNHPRKSNN